MTKRRLRRMRDASVLAAALMLLGATGAALRQQATATPAKAIVPVSASTLAANPDPYYGAVVSVTGVVERSVSKLAFSIDQDNKATGREVLVLTKLLNEPVETNTYVTVIGDVVRFDPDELGTHAKDYMLGLSFDVASSFRGRPVVLANAVVNVAGVDLARRLPPPITPDEEAHAKIMKQIGPANSALRKAIDAMDPALTREQTAVLKHALADTADFWKRRRRTDAIGWAQDAWKQTEIIDRAAAAGDWELVKTSVTTLGESCQNCHGAYRERFDDGSYRFKPDTNESKKR
jgi:cytochrome c556